MDVRIVRCPACKKVNEIGESQPAGSVFACMQCGVELKLISFDPPRLEKV
jgi:lysine biosynthesis protein LysW